MVKYVITITRQFGSLGRPIAKRLSEILNIEYYDRDIVEASAQKLNLPVSVISDQEESCSDFFKMLFPLGTQNPGNQKKIFETQSKIIQELADKETCIIVGRCSDYILRNEENAMHVYIYAPLDARMKNCVESLGMSKSEAEKMILSVDKARNSFHKQYAKYSPEEPSSKHILVNSAFLGVEGTAQLLAYTVRKKFGELKVV
ncbi:AAA family ATPase [uncultured Clostridium sp.]|uniref:cytidylate kinase-like family protein n=1 Tax=uncultured Clostridium sp. TaxID=59620 RepID=UPI0025E16C22|nr:cytidylate kinase-like family protein [uncultured Clostridium sp.]